MAETLRAMTRIERGKTYRARYRVSSFIFGPYQWQFDNLQRYLTAQAPKHGMRVSGFARKGDDAFEVDFVAERDSTAPQEIFDTPFDGWAAVIVPGYALSYWIRSTLEWVKEVVVASGAALGFGLGALVVLGLVVVAFVIFAKVKG